MNPTIEELEYKLIKAERKMLRIHAGYLAIAFLILGLFLFLLAPVTVCPNAFQNFSFASTIVSIVLAVVSIVYSFRSQSNSSDNISGIREIERNIASKLERFDSMKTELVDEVKSITRPIREEVSNIRMGQVEASNQMQLMIEKMSQKSVDTHDGSGHLLNRTSFYGNVLMYVLCKAMQTGKEVDFDKIGLNMSKNFDYFWGFVIALGSLNVDVFACDVTTEKVIKVKNYNFEQLGDESYWRSFILSFKNKSESKKYLDAIDLYFADNDSNEVGMD